MPLIEIPVEELHRTDKAVRVLSEVTGRKIWIPLSLIKDFTGTDDDGYTSIFVSDSVAEDKDLI